MPPRRRFTDLAGAHDASTVLDSTNTLQLRNASMVASGLLTDSSVKDPTIQPDTDAEDGFERRQTFSRFRERDRELLLELAPAVERASDAIVDSFYEHLLQFEPMRDLLRNAETVSRLKEFQRKYLAGLTAGDYGPTYQSDRLRLGHTHARIGLEPDWYLGTYALYLDLLAPVIREHYSDDAGRAVDATVAMAKLMIIDMQMVLDAYYGLREKRAVERTEQLAAVGELSASIAHEVRNPLAGMKGALQVLRKSFSVDPGNQEIVDELLAQIERLENLVRDLLTYARPRALDPRQFDLHEMLDRLQRLYKDQSDPKNVTLVRKYGPNTGELYADPTQLEQVFLNLMHNAMQAMERGGRLSIITQAEDEAIEISFKDTGKGIAAADLPRIFQPFFTTRHRGSGLGLPIVSKIAKAHGGSIDIASRPGRGTKATVRIPLRPKKED